MIDVRCACGEVFDAADDQGGKRIRCRRCGAVLSVVPAAGAMYDPSDFGLPAAPSDDPDSASPTAAEIDRLCEAIPPRDPEPLPAWMEALGAYARSGLAVVGFIAFILPVGPVLYLHFASAGAHPMLTWIAQMCVTVWGVLIAGAVVLGVGRLAWGVWRRFRVLQ
jgi:hypothetical protein